MSFKIRRPRRARREAKRAAWEKSVRIEAANRPPEIVYRPARAPAGVESRTDEKFGYIDVVELNKRPDNRVIAAPVRITPRRSYAFDGRYDAVSPCMDVEMFQSVPYALQVGGTQFVWWSWAPVRDALKPEVAAGHRRARYGAERIRQMLDYRVIAMHPSDERDFREWLTIVIEDCEANLGMP